VRHVQPISLPVVQNSVAETEVDSQGHFLWNSDLHELKGQACDMEKGARVNRKIDANHLTVRTHANSTQVVR
jgi:hypothetical protein